VFARPVHTPSLSRGCFKRTSRRISLLSILR
jgi:hypothetical protein